MVHRPAETIEPHTETIAVRNANGFGLLESSGDDCIGAVTLSVDRLRVPKEGLRRLHGRARKGLQICKHINVDDRQRLGLEPPSFCGRLLKVAVFIAE